MYGVKPVKTTLAQTLIRLEKLQNRGYSKAEFELGRINMFRGQPENLDQAHDLLTRALEHGETDAISYLAVLNFLRNDDRNETNLKAMLKNGKDKNVGMCYALDLWFDYNRKPDLKLVDDSVIADLKAGVAQNDNLSAVLLALILMKNEEYPQYYDTKRALEILTEAADRKCSYACYYLARAHFGALGTPYDKTKGKARLAEAMKMGCPAAFVAAASPPFSLFNDNSLSNAGKVTGDLKLYLIQARAHFLPLYNSRPNEVAALDCLDTGFQHGSRECLLYIAKYYHNSKNYEKCTEICLKGLDRNYPDFNYYLALYALGGYDVSYDAEKAKQYLIAGMKGGIAKCFTLLLERLPDCYEEAIAIWKTLIQMRHRQAFKIVTESFLPCRKKWIETIIQILIKQKGDSEAQFALAACYIDRQEDRYDIFKAITTLERAPQSSGAINRMYGELYIHGILSDPDHNQKIEKFQKAFDLGDADVCANLARNYESIGNGVARDLKKRDRILKIGAYRGSPGAMNDLAIGVTKKTPFNFVKYKAYMAVAAMFTTNSTKMLQSDYATMMKGDMTLSRFFALLGKWHGSHQSFRILASDYDRYKLPEAAAECLVENLIDGDIKSVDPLGKLIKKYKKMSAFPEKGLAMVQSEMGKGRPFSFVAMAEFCLIQFGMKRNFAKAMEYFQMYVERSDPTIFMDVFKDAKRTELRKTSSPYTYDRFKAISEAMNIRTPFTYFYIIFKCCEQQSRKYLVKMIQRFDLPKHDGAWTHSRSPSRIYNRI